MATTVALFALLFALTGPRVALAATIWREGASGAPFHLASAGGTVIGGSPSDQTITLPFVNAWTAPTSVSPWSVVANGASILVAEPDSGLVQSLDNRGVGSPIAFTDAMRLNKPRWASPTPKGTLIADTNNSRVVEVDGVGSVIWTYGSPTTLGFPGSAVRTPSGTTLIADTNNNRVIEVSAEGTLLGQYGGGSTGYLKSPGCVVRIGERTLITDTGNSRLVILGSVAHDAAPTIVGSGVLNKPTSAVQTPSGTLLVADTENNRVVELDEGGQILAVLNAGMSAPRSAARLSDGSTAIAYGDTGNRHLQGQAPGGNSGTAASSALDLGLPGVTKRLKSIAWNAIVPSGAGLDFSYRLNSGSWKRFPKGGVFSPAASFTTFEYKATLTGSGAGVPTLNDLAFSWDFVPAPTATGGTPFGTGTGLGTGLGTGFGPGTGFGTAGGSYVGTGTSTPEVIFDNGVRRGWVMEGVGGFGTGKLPGPGGLASQPLTRKQAAGLALLGGMWGIGIALQPIGKLLLVLRGMLPFGLISGR